MCQLDPPAADEESRRGSSAKKYRGDSPKSRGGKHAQNPLFPVKYLHPLTLRLCCLRRNQRDPSSVRRRRRVGLPPAQGLLLSDAPLSPVHSPITLPVIYNNVPPLSGHQGRPQGPLFRQLPLPSPRPRSPNPSPNAPLSSPSRSPRSVE